MKLPEMVFTVLGLNILAGCNLYAPLNSKQSDSDYLAEAQRCLNESNISCAIMNYESIRESVVRDQKLCEVTLVEGGLTLGILLTNIKGGDSKMLGELAKAMTPWTQAKSDSLDLAKSYCVSFVESAGTSDSSSLAVLLNTLTLMSHCAIRMAKADIYVANSESDVSCSTPGNANGVLEANEIADGSNGSINSAGMCTTDVSMCASDIQLIQGNALSSAGFQDISTVFELILSPLRLSGSGVRAIRKAIQDSIN